MPQAAKAKCPGCQNVLRIPAEWLQTTVRCKHCGMTLQAKPSKAASTNGQQRLRDALAAPAPIAADPEPLVAVAESANGHFDFDRQPDASTSETVQRYRRRARIRAMRNFLTPLLFIAVAAGVIYWNRGAIIAQFNDATKLPPASDNSGNQPVPANNKEEPQKIEAPAEPAVVFPRRLLAININNYLYANPISSGASERESLPNDAGARVGVDRDFHTTLQRFAEFLHVPPEQLVELSDVAPAQLAKPPLKPVIESTVHAFLAGCRKQDRVIIMFIGHALEIGDDCFLVPIEGDLKIKETLVPLNWLYEEMKKCPAQQKVVIMDVCRYNPTRGLERPAPGVMGPKLDATLKNPPEGVQVVSACVAGQYSYEGPIQLNSGDRNQYTNSYFLNELYELMGARRINPGIQKPESPLPIDVLVNGAPPMAGEPAATEDAKTAKIVKPRAWFKATEVAVADQADAKQTPRLSGTASTATVPFEPGEPMPAKVAIQVPPPADGEPASRQEVQKILDEIESQMAREGEISIKVDALPPFTKQRLAEYADDGKMTPFREEIVRTAKLLKKHAKTFQYTFTGSCEGTEIKKFILKNQEEPARAFGELQTQLENLQETGEQKRAEKSKRWLANYDFVLARLEYRLAAIYEYNYMLGRIRKDALPKRDPAKTAGLRLASQEKLQSGSESRKLANDAKKILTKIIQKHKGTPWEVLAKRQELTALGLEWQAIPK